MPFSILFEEVAFETLESKSKQKEISHYHITRMRRSVRLRPLISSKVTNSEFAWNSLEQEEKTKAFQGKKNKKPGKKGDADEVRISLVDHRELVTTDSYGHIGKPSFGLGRRNLVHATLGLVFSYTVRARDRFIRKYKRNVCAYFVVVLVLPKASFARAILVGFRVQNTPLPPRVLCWECVDWKRHCSTIRLVMYEYSIGTSK